MSEVPITPSVQVKYTQLLIDGKFVDAASGKTFQTLDPRTGEVIANVAEGGAEDINRAVAAARKAFDERPWPKMTAYERQKILLRFADLLGSTMMNLQPLRLGTVGSHINRLLQMISNGWADKIHGLTVPANGPFHMQTLHEPIGVAGGIIPWNFPLLMFFWKVGPALACGNTIVLKPAEQTPLTALVAAKLLHEAGLPPGVLNVIPGCGPTAGAALASHMDVDKAVELAHFALFFNQGQCCCAGSRTFVHESIYDKFVEKAKQRALKHSVGDPFKEGTEQGPQIDTEQFNKILKYIKSGVECGATLESGGERLGDKGYYIKPTVFSNVKDDMLIAKDEIFSPVQTILKFKDLDEVIRRANATHYGLAAGIFSKNIDTINTLTRALRVGTVWVNCYDVFDAAIPFGGYKRIGHGREKGMYSLENYLQVKSVCTPLVNPAWL
ncbi:hypothetical protein ACJW31_03G151300 [Castanea mollissima]